MNAAYTLKRLVDVGRGLRIQRQLEGHEHWTRAQILELQQQRLTALVRHAVSSSPFYRQWYGPTLSDAEIALEELPVLSRPP